MAFMGYSIGHIMGRMEKAAENRQVVIEAWNTIQAEEWDELDRFFAPEYVRITARGVYSFEEFRAGITASHAAFKSEAARIESMVADDERVAFAWELTTKHEREYLGIPPTHRIVTFSGLTISRLERGRIVEDRASWNRHAVLEALGIIPLDPR
jgi:predicted ester cyclase